MHIAYDINKYITCIWMTAKCNQIIIVVCNMCILRMQFNLSHEYCHIIHHTHANIVIPRTEKNGRRKEMLRIIGHFFALDECFVVVKQ